MKKFDEKFLERVFDSVTDPFVIYDSDFRIIRTNRALMALFGFTSEQVVGRNCYEMFYHRTEICDDCHVTEVFQTGEPRMLEKRIQIPDGSERIFEVHSYPIKDENGITTQAVEHARDITQRKMIEKSLWNTEERFRHAFEDANVGMCLVDPEGRFLKVNNRMCEIFGYTQKELESMVVNDITHPDYMDVSPRFIRRASSGEITSTEFEKQYYHKNGRVIWGQVASSLIRDADGGSLCFISHVKDITERKNLQDKLQTSKEFNDQIINSITDSLIVVDPKNYRILQANDFFHTRVGLKPPAAIGKRCHEIILNASAPCKESGIQCPMEKTIQTKQPALSDKIYPNAEGKDRMLEVSAYPILDAQGQVKSIIRLERDVTEKRKTERALDFRSRELQRTQHQLETLFEISRLVSTKNSLLELVDFVLDMGQKIFPGSEILLFLFDAENHNFIDLESGNSAMAELCLNVRQILDQSGLLLEFIRHLKNIKDPHVVSGNDINNIPPLQEFIAKRYVNCFGLPISTPQQCIGYAVLGSPVPVEYSREDLHFFQGFFSLIAGHIRHLVIHESEIGLLQQKIDERMNDGKIVGQSDKMQKLYKMIDLVAGSDATVLITGENGTGKEMVAQAIHQQSHRKNRPFIVANCSAYSSTLLESELFGHEKGAFTGAIKRKQGRIERAQGGTLFLDEIGNINPATQVMMLRFLQDRCFERVGGEETIETDVRVLAATNLDLYKEMEAGRFRDDLFYRLNVVSIHLPRLIERKEDIPLLCRHFLKKYGLKEGKNTLSFSPETMQILMDYDWPGNVRQLENAVSHAVILAQGQHIETMHLPQSINPSVTVHSSTSLTENERLLIHRVLQESAWNKHEAARRLEVSRSTLYGKIKRYGLKRE
ncbi:sigma 54-interacting transcriptional regulator [Thermodesulfobacteriota bacterium]